MTSRERIIHSYTVNSQYCAACRFPSCPWVTRHHTADLRDRAADAHTMEHASPA